MCSDAYRKIQKGVKEKQLTIEQKSSEVENLLSDFENLQVGKSGERVDQDLIEVDGGELKTAKSSHRSLIVTPGGTKRKGK